MRRHMLTSENEEMQGIRVRGLEVTRLEGLTDAMFGFAITLLIVSLEPPTEFGQLVNLVLSFPAFAITFLLMLFIWYWHYRFFRQYGLNSGKVMWVNGILLFLVLLFVYPLKFIATVVIDYVILEGWFGFDMPTVLMIGPGQYPVLHTLYAAGFAAVFICFAWLYKLALDAKDQLELTPYEVLSTRSHVVMYLIVAAVPLFTIALVWLPTPWAPMIAGFSNCLIWPATMIYERRMQPKFAALREAEAA